MLQQGTIEGEGRSGRTYDIQDEEIQNNGRRIQEQVEALRCDDGHSVRARQPEDNGNDGSLREIITVQEDWLYDK